MLDGLNQSDEAMVRASLVGVGELMLEQYKDMEGCGKFFNQHTTHNLRKDIDFLKNNKFVQSDLEVDVTYGNGEEDMYSYPDFGRRLSFANIGYTFPPKPDSLFSECGYSQELLSLGESIKDLNAKKEELYSQPDMGRRLNTDPFSSAILGKQMTSSKWEKDLT